MATISLSKSTITNGASAYSHIQQLPTKNETPESTKSICCLYAYYEKNEEYKCNFEYFIKNGGIIDSVDYYIIINGKCSVDLSVFNKNPKITIIYRENQGLDFGAYSHTIHNFIQKTYDYYFFMNTSVIGPCFEEISGSRPRLKWTDSFIELFTDDSVKVVGTSINIHVPFFKIPQWKEILEANYGKKNVYSHVQSMFFCITADYFHYLKKKMFFNQDELHHDNYGIIIIQKEIGLSQIALNAGWNINCILPKYRGLDYRAIQHNMNISAELENGDPYNPNCYFGGTIDKHDVIFFKNNRF
jgi:hypothetical protein